MKKRMVPVLMLLGIFSCLRSAPLAMAESFTFGDSIVYDGLGSNGINDMLFLDDTTFFFGTGYGLSVTPDAGETFYSFYNNPSAVRYGGVTAITSIGNRIWVATAFDSTGVEESSATGNGISMSDDGGQTWSSIPQMIDHPDSVFAIVFGDTIDALPTTVPIDNVTYDLAVHVNADGDTLLWAVSFAGGTRVSADLGQTWKRVVLPPDNQDVLNAESDHDFDLSPVTRTDLGIGGNYNHRAFSVVARNDTVVVGTAGGVNMSTDSGRSWRKFTAQNSGLSGNFIVALHFADDGTIYAAALPAVGAGEYQSLSYTVTGSLGALYWETALRDKRLYNISTTPGGGRIFAATQTGLWVSGDKWSWVPMAYPYDPVSGDRLYSNEIYTAKTGPGGRLWAGTGDGLAHTSDNGISWTIVRRVTAIGKTGEFKISAYPNPFSPGRMNVFEDEGYIRFHVLAPEAGTLSIDIFDFGMNTVKKAVQSVRVDAGAKDFAWNGRNGLGEIPANGTYFVRASFRGGSGKKTAWTKIIILE